MVDNAEFASTQKRIRCLLLPEGATKS